LSDLQSARARWSSWLRRRRGRSITTTSAPSTSCSAYCAKRRGSPRARSSRWTSPFSASAGKVVRIVGSGEEETSGQIPFTPRAKKVLELALREALSLGHNYIGTEHILLGLARENEGVAARILLDFDADSEKIRNEVIRMLSGPGARESGEVTMVGGRVGRGDFDQAWLDGLGAVLDQLAVEIRGKLRREPDAGDLLLALACAPDTLPAQVLGELGVDLDALWGTIERAASRSRVSARRPPTLGSSSHNRPARCVALSSRRFRCKSLSARLGCATRSANS